MVDSESINSKPGGHAGSYSGHDDIQRHRNRTSDSCNT